jgi:hypothetical protein
LLHGQRGKDQARRVRSGLIGRDLAHMRPSRPARSRLPLLALIGVLMAALGLSALRIDLIRQGYDLATAMREEKDLLERRRVLTAQVRSLRDPARLARLAEELGFERPDRVTEIDAHAVSAGPRP